MRQKSSCACGCPISKGMKSKLRKKNYLFSWIIKVFLRSLCASFTVIWSKSMLLFCISLAWIGLQIQATAKRINYDCWKYNHILEMWIIIHFLKQTFSVGSISICTFAVFRSAIWNLRWKFYFCNNKQTKGITLTQTDWIRWIMDWGSKKQMFFICMKRHQAPTEFYFGAPPLTTTHQYIQHTLVCVMFRGFRLNI